MDADLFDAFLRLLAASPSRRALLGLAGLGLAGPGPGGAEALKRKRRRHGKRIRRNAFGCVNVGGYCERDAHCCSGVCGGHRCRAHDASTCEAGQNIQDVCGGAIDVPCTTSTGAAGTCSTTTGNAPYCPRESYCHECRKDADCRPFCGAAAACVQCAGCVDDGGTACASPTIGLCEFPAEAPRDRH